MSRHPAQVLHMIIYEFRLMGTARVQWAHKLQVSGKTRIVNRKRSIWAKLHPGSQAHMSTPKPTWNRHVPPLCKVSTCVYLWFQAVVVRKTTTPGTHYKIQIYFVYVNHVNIWFLHHKYLIHVFICDFRLLYFAKRRLLAHTTKYKSALFTSATWTCGFFSTHT